MRSSLHGAYMYMGQRDSKQMTTLIPSRGKGCGMPGIKQESGTGTDKSFSERKGSVSSMLAR